MKDSLSNITILYPTPQGIWVHFHRTMSPRVLLLGGHGKVSLLMTPMMLSRSWQVTSVVRNPDHEEEIRSGAKGQPGKLNVLVSSLEDIKSAQQAQSLIDKTKPDWVVWSAGMLKFSSLITTTHRMCRCWWKRWPRTYSCHRLSCRPACHYSIASHAEHQEVPDGFVHWQPAKPTSLVQRSRLVRHAQDEQ